MKIGLAGISHETHTFLPQRTGNEPFEADAISGETLIEQFRGTNTVMGGFLAECDSAAEPIEYVPAVHTRGGVSGTVEEAVFDRYVGQIRSAFEGEDLDGVLLFLHGAMVTTERHDPETDIVNAVHDEVGEDVPVAVGLDLHANVSEEFVRETTAACGYLSSPHVDQAETGRRAARLLLDTLDGRVSPTASIAKPGLVVPSVFSATSVRPAKDIISRAITWRTNPELHDVARWEKRDAILDVSVFFGFAWADVPQLGFGVVVTTDDDPDLAQAVATEVADLAWDNRKALTDPASLYSVEAGVERALGVGASSDSPVLLVDHADRLAETTFVLRELQEQNASNVAIPLLHDPEAVATCEEAGEGSTVQLQVGSKSSPRGGGPVELTGQVEFLGERTYTAPGPLNAGEAVSHGQTAIIRADGLWVQLTSRMDGAGLTNIAPIEEYGYDASDFDVIVSKSKTHFRAVFEDWAAEIVIVDAPEYSPADLSSFTYENVPDGVYPITSD